MRTFKPPVADFRPPSEINAPIRADGYIPPAEPTSAYSPPDKDYLPPVEPVTDDPEIPVPPLPEELPPDVDIDDGHYDDDRNDEKEMVASDLFELESKAFFSCMR